MHARQPVLFVYPPLKSGKICQTVRTVKPKSSRGSLLPSPSQSEATPFAGLPTYREYTSGKGGGGFLQPDSGLLILLVTQSFD
jgi:hypothetical protein